MEANTSYPWSRRPEARGGRRAARRGSASLLSVLAIAVAAPVAAQVFLTQEEALSLVFPEPITVERATAFLDEDQLRAAQDLAGNTRLDQRVVTYYVGRRGGEAVGVAYFDAHRVRTVAEVVMIVVTPDGTIDRVEVLSFMEPPEYMASDAWIAQLPGRRLTDELAVDRSIVNMTGATLTAGALTGAARRVLALHEVIGPLASEGPP